MALLSKPYPATLAVDYPKKLDRISTLLRLIWIIPILVLMSILMGGGNEWTSGRDAAKQHSFNASFHAGGIVIGLAVATALMIVVRQRYPRWWFDFALELNRFTTRIGAYLFLLTDKYPSTEEKQSVHQDANYPNAKKDLNRWLPLVKWLLALPHYVVLIVLTVAALGATIIAWFSILFTGKYPRGLFDFVVGVMRWNWRVNAYAILLTTDKYPPFSLK